MGDEVGIHEIKGKPTNKVKTLPKIYTAERIIGNGSFGVVYKAIEDERNLTEEEKVEFIQKKK